ncbi:hypothetical protein SAY87_009882 [Trapa incisa]|uniref:BZIP domain-containing protein n=1 Tax=Trapa incisa TaxID=236973 RepID=A0AAN7Q3I5_9MYRT|nr:hypothetical protein SAY87_009882 [Trapa incisa]
MGFQTMELQEGGGGGGSGSSKGKDTQLQGLARQGSIYSLTLNEVQDQLCDLGKPLTSMNLDELLKNVCTAEANQSLAMGVDGTASRNENNLQRQASLSLNGALSKKTVDEVWRNIQHNKNNEENKSQDRQPTLGEMTLEDFLAKAGVEIESSAAKKRETSSAGVNTGVTPQFPVQGSWMQYTPQAQFLHPPQNMMGAYMPAQALPQPLQIGAGAVMDISYTDSQIPVPSPVMGTSSDTPTSGRKRGMPDGIIEKSVERRQKRMIKNRESAARSRARKQAYTNELEQKVSRLEEENERLRKRKAFENMLPTAQPSEPRHQLRRTSSAPF